MDHIKPWLAAHGHADTLRKIERLENSWLKKGLQTRRNWWDVLAGRENGEPISVEDETFPVITEIRKRKWPLAHSRSSKVQPVVPPTAALPPAAPSMTYSKGEPFQASCHLLSSRLANETRGHLGKELRHALSRAEHVKWASAYYGEEFLRKVVPKGARAEFVFNGLLGRRLDDQRQELLRLQAALGRSAEIRLSFLPGIFHTKLILVLASGRWVGFVGSANASDAAIGRGDRPPNEEVLIRMQGQLVSLHSYFDAIWNEAKPLDDIREPEIRGLVPFFRTGVLYFKPSTIAQFRYKLHLPQATREALARSPLANIGFSARTSAATYDPVRGLDGIERTGERGRLSLRREAIETCYGWWVPEEYREGVQGKIDEASRARKARISKTISALKRGIENREIVRVAKGRFRKLHAWLEENKLAEGQSLKDRIVDFSRHLDRLKTKFSNDRWVLRVSSAYTTAVVPEIWDDPTASEEFADSFFDYIAYVNASKAVPLVVKSIRKAAGFEPGAGQEEMKSLLTQCLKTKGWSNDFWLKK